MPPLGDDAAQAEPVKLLLIPQLVDAGTVEPREMLPSFCYLGTEADRAGGALDLPWASGRGGGVAVGGEAAVGGDLPMRTVVSAKSWLGGEPGRSACGDFAAECPGGRGEGFAGRSFPAISGTSGQRLGHGAFPDAPIAQQGAWC